MAAGFFLRTIASLFSGSLDSLWVEFAGGQKAAVHGSIQLDPSTGLVLDAQAPVQIRPRDRLRFGPITVVAGQTGTFFQEDMLGFNTVNIQVVSGTGFVFGASTSIDGTNFVGTDVKKGSFSTSGQAPQGSINSIEMYQARSRGAYFKLAIGTTPATDTVLFVEFSNTPFQNTVTVAGAVDAGNGILHAPVLFGVADTSNVIRNAKGNPEGKVFVSREPFDVALSFSRPADTTAYAAGDVVGGPLTFATVGPSARAIKIVGTQLEVDIAAIPSGMTSFRLYLYSVTPPSALADNAVFDLPSGDRASFLGYVDLGSPVDLGSTLYVEANNINKQFKLAGANLYGYLVTTGAYTPSSADPFKVTLHIEAV